MICQLTIGVFLLANSALPSWLRALANCEPLVMLPILFAVIMLLGWAAGELSIENDPVRSHQRFKAQQKKQKSQTRIRF